MAARHEIIAKYFMALKKRTTNTEKVFSELIQMREVQKEYTSREIKKVMAARHPKMSEVHLAKALHELKYYNYLLKRNNKYTLNIN